MAAIAYIPNADLRREAESRAGAIDAGGVSSLPSTFDDRRESQSSAVVDVLIVEIAGRKFGIRVERIRELLRAAAIVPLADAPEIEGLVNLHGTVTPVFDLRARLRIPPKRLEPSDQFVAIACGSRVVAVRVDRAVDLVQFRAEELQPAGEAYPPGGCTPYVATRPGELVPILEVEALFLHAAPALCTSAAAGRQAAGEEATR